MPSFDLARKYATQNRLIDQSSRFPQEVTALKSLAAPGALASFDWTYYERQASELFERARVFVRSPNAKRKAWRVGYAPYNDVTRLHLLQVVADELDIDVTVGDEAHRTSEYADTVPVMFFRREQ